MASLNQWYEEIIAEVPGATMGGVMQALRRTFRKFCQDSGAYILEGETQIDITADVADYNVINAFPTFITQDDHIPIYIWEIGYYENFIEQNEFYRKLVALQTPDFRVQSRSPSNAPWAYTTDIRNPGGFTLRPVVDRDIPSALAVFVAFRLKDYPDFPDDTLPDVFFTHWFDIIRDGAIGDLCGQQDKSYTNPQLAVVHQRRFRNGVARARDEARNQFNTSENEFRYPVGGGWVTTRYY